MNEPSERQRADIDRQVQAIPAEAPAQRGRELDDLREAKEGR